MSPLPPPAARLRACVVVPARDEEERIASCVAALARQEDVDHDEYEVILVLDGCADRTAQRAHDEAERHPGFTLLVVAPDAGGAGRSRRAGMELACARLTGLGLADGLIASTDADTVPDRRWLRHQLDLVAGGARAIGGVIEVDPGDLAHGDLRPRESRLRRRLAAVGDEGGEVVEHPFFSGASIGITVEAYRRTGGLRPLATLEDQALERSLIDNAIPITRSMSVRVLTSGRTDGRARHGLSADLRADSWTRRRTSRAGDHDAADLARRKTGRVSVVLPCREVAGTVGGILSAIRPLEAAGLVDEVLVIDAGSSDGTAAVAAAHGARVVDEDELMPQFGPCRGKGDAMWRALAATDGDIVAYVDADTLDFDPGFVTGLLGPLILDPSVSLVKGTFRRPLRVGGTVSPDEGGRVTELVARPLLSLISPELGVFAQPLAGETAGRRALLERLPFPVGYGIETAMLIDALAEVGLDGLAQVDLGTRQNRHQPLRALSAMALSVMCAGLRRRLPREVYEEMAAGRMLVPADDGAMQVRDVSLDERPPIAAVRAAEEPAAASGPR
jgi:glycosyltransferase involved in cell wall biosynthesis